MVQIIGVPANKIRSLQKATQWNFDSFAERSRGEATAEGLYQDVENMDRQCWVALVDDKVGAVALTETLSNGVIQVTHCAGNTREDWIDDLHDEIIAWGKSLGYWRIRVSCRPGWSKYFKSKGFTETHRLMEIDIE